MTILLFFCNIDFKKSSMSKGRLEAFSDGVLAIIITIMVLELKIPGGDQLSSLKPLLHTILSYVVSFIYVGIYWNNHHHLFQSVTHIKGNVLWKNLHLLFWLSLIPFVTAWVGEHQMSATPVAIYGVVLLMAAFAWYLLLTTLLKNEGPHSKLARSLGNDKKTFISIVIYFTGILSSFFIHPWLGYACYILVAILWFIPDKRIEKLNEQ